MLWYGGNYTIYISNNYLIALTTAENNEGREAISLTYCGEVHYYFDLPCILASSDSATASRKASSIVGGPETSFPPPSPSSLASRHAERRLSLPPDSPVDPDFSVGEGGYFRLPILLRNDCSFETLASTEECSFILFKLN